MVNTKIRWIIFFAVENGEVLYSAKTRPGADCGSDHELLIAKCRLKLKKAGKATRPCRSDLNQIPYDRTAEMNRFKGLDLVDRAPKELRVEVCNSIQDVVAKPSQRKRNARRQSGVWGGFTKEEKHKAREKRENWMQRFRDSKEREESLLK